MKKQLTGSTGSGCCRRPRHRLLAGKRTIGEAEDPRHLHGVSPTDERMLDARDIRGMQRSC
jgi:hypothetical protein